MTRYTGTHGDVMHGVALSLVPTLGYRTTVHTHPAVTQLGVLAVIIVLAGGTSCRTWR